MGYFQQRPESLTVLLAQVWDRRSGVTIPYRTNFRGYAWPVIEYVPAAGEVPAHGILHGAEGDIVVNNGDYITLHPATGEVAASSWYAFVGGYEEVLNAPA